jgi:hypothetical protein
MPTTKRPIDDHDWPFHLPKEWGEAGHRLFYLKFQQWLDDVAAGRARWGTPKVEHEKPAA